MIFPSDSEIREYNNTLISLILLNISLFRHKNTIVVSKSEGQSYWRRRRLLCSSRFVVSVFLPFYERIKFVTTETDIKAHTRKDASTHTMNAHMRINKFCSSVVTYRQKTYNTGQHVTTTRLQHDYNNNTYYNTLHMIRGDFSC